MRTMPNDIFFTEVEHIIAEGGEVVLCVKGNSMRPFIRSDRTRVRFSMCDPQSLKRGDIVLFRYHDRHIMHRIIRREGDRLLLAGDGNYRKTEQCTTDDVAAIVTAVIRPNGRVIPCDSTIWRTASAIWISLPQTVRRIILGLLRHIGIK